MVNLVRTLTVVFQGPKLLIILKSVQNAQVGFLFSYLNILLVEFHIFIELNLKVYAVNIEYSRCCRKAQSQSVSLELNYFFLIPKIPTLFYTWRKNLFFFDDPRCKPHFPVDLQTVAQAGVYLVQRGESLGLLGRLGHMGLLRPLGLSGHLRKVSPEKY